MCKRSFLKSLVLGAVVIILSTSCGANPAAPSTTSPPASTHYLYDFTPIANSANGALYSSGTSLYRVVDTDARIVCYIYNGSSLECLPFPDGAFEGE